jgi:hypothetical protein
MKIPPGTSSVTKNVHFHPDKMGEICEDKEA